MYRKTLYSDLVTIDCPIEKVWQVLLDIERYPEWNPFTNPVISTMEIGDTVELHVKMPIRGDRIQREKLICKNIEETLSWGMSMIHPVFLRAQRDQKLIVVSDKQCTYQTWDAFQGLLTPIVIRFFEKDIVNGFNDCAYALKNYCEDL